MYARHMEVAISALRADLAGWVDRAREGEDVVVTERGVPVARLIAVDTAPIISRLIREGVVGKPRQTGRPSATGRQRVRARGGVSDLVSEQRG